MASSSSASELDAECITLEEALARCDHRGSHARRVLLAACAACACGGMGGAVSAFLMSPITAEDAPLPIQMH